MAASPLAINQTFTVTGGSTEVALDGSRTYTVTGVTSGEALRIVLLDPEVVDGDKIDITAGVDSLGNRLATLTTAADVTVDTINGVTLGAAAVAVDFTPQATSFTFRVKNDDAAVKTVPVVFKKVAAADDTLPVNLAGAPKQAFGIGGQVEFKAAVATVAESDSIADLAAVTDDDGDGTVAAQVHSLIGTTGFRIKNDNADGTASAGQLIMRDHDVYQYAGATITRAQFQSILGVDDTLGGKYVKGSTDADKSTFNIETDVVNVPVLDSVTTDLGQVTVKWTPGTQSSPNGTTFTLQRRGVTAGEDPIVALPGTPGEFTTVFTGTVSSLSQQTFVETLTSGSYQYRIQTSLPAFTGATKPADVDGAEVVVSTSATATAPTLRRVYLTSNASDINNLSSGNVFKVVTTQAMNTPATGATLTVGTKVFTFTAATSTAAGSATFSVNTAAETVDGVSHSAGKVLTVTLLANPVDGPLPFDADLNLTAASGIGNNAGVLTGLGLNNRLTRDVTS